MTIDCTFTVVSKFFGQLMIIMAYFETYDLYVPIYYLLLDSKEQEVYEAALNLVVISTNKTIDAVSIVCDFELGLMNAIEMEFRKAKMIGCLFHLKQS